MIEMIRRKPALAAVAAVVMLAALMLGAMLLLKRAPAPQPPDAPVPAAGSLPAVRVEDEAAGDRKAAAPQEPADWRRAPIGIAAVARSFPEAVRAARSGDPAARYHVARTLRFCRLEALAGPGTAETVRDACGAIVSSPGLAELASGGPAEAWAAMLSEAVRAGEPRAMAYAALHCVDGAPCDPMGGKDRNMSLASAQSRAGRAIASGDAEAIFHAGLAIASESVGRNAVRGAAWMLVACARGYDCSAANQLNEALICPAGQSGCVPGGNVADVLQASLGADEYAAAFAMSQEFAQLLEGGEPPVGTWSFGP